jgi:hypothetical protein
MKMEELWQSERERASLVPVSPLEISKHAERSITVQRHGEHHLPQVGATYARRGGMPDPFPIAQCSHCSKLECDSERRRSASVSSRLLLNRRTCIIE